MVAPKMFSQPNNPNCTMKMFKTYLNHMPEDIKNQRTSRFFLRPRHSSFREEDFLEIDQSKTRITCGSHVC
jgi:hypothetical protein